jgi:hemoglobin
MTALRMTLAVAALATTLAATPLPAQEKAQAPAPNPLYERLGGLYSIAAVVDDFIERLYINPTLNANPAIGNARSDLRKPGLKTQLTMLVCQVTGGPYKYVGKNMKESHAGFNITEKEWDAMVADFKATLEKFKVPAAEQQELIAIVATTKPDIVVGAAPVAAQDSPASR